MNDGEANSEHDTVNITAVVLGENNPREITSIPISNAVEGLSYVCYVEAVDPDGHPLTYLLDMAPEGMSIDSVNGGDPVNT